MDIVSYLPMMGIVSYQLAVAHHTQPSLLRIAAVVKALKVVDIQVSRVKNDHDVVRRNIIVHHMMDRISLEMMV